MSVTAGQAAQKLNVAPRVVIAVVTAGQAVQKLNGAVGALLGYMSGDTDRDTTLGKLGAGLEGLAWHRENVRKSAQPELDLGGE